MEQCLIEGCENEAKLIAKSGGRSYYSCKEHKKEVAQIVSSEHTKSELKRYSDAAEKMYEKKYIPEFMRL